MNLVFLIFIGNEKPTMIQETLINKVILEYYEEYFHPFKGYTNKEREELRERLKLEDKKNGTYDKYQQEQREAFRKEQEARMDESEPCQEDDAGGHERPLPDDYRGTNRQDGRKEKEPSCDRTLLQFLL